MYVVHISQNLNRSRNDIKAWTISIDWRVGLSHPEPVRPMHKRPFVIAQKWHGVVLTLDEAREAISEITGCNCIVAENLLTRYVSIALY